MKDQKLFSQSLLSGNYFKLSLISGSRYT